MTTDGTSRSTSFSVAARYALGVIQGFVGLFAAGAVIYEAHSLFLWYYAREWVGVQLSGVNGCQGEDAVANGDLFDGKTFCNQPENLVPWIVIYKRHLPEAVLYYGVLIALVLSIAALWIWAQRRSRLPDPTQQQPHGTSSDREVI